MFITFFLKTILILLTYLALIVSFAISFQYIRQFFSYLKGMKIEGELSSLKSKAKAIVITADLSVMIFSIWMIKATLAWQIDLVTGIENAAEAQPIVMLLLAFLVVHPIITLRKWAMESE